jgi:serine/threonine-protein kinase HipA
MPKNDIINLKAFGLEIGRIGYDEELNRSSFQYHPDFLKNKQHTQFFPNTGVIRRVPQVQLFNSLDKSSFQGLPPQIADSLPDMFGNLIFKTWLDSQDNKEISIIEQLAYISTRGMGALEYVPSKKIPKNTSINLEEIIEVLRSVLDIKSSSRQKKLNSRALLNIFKIGTSAGGARPKILISKNKNNKEVIPGDLEYSADYDHLLIKLALEDNDSYPREVIEYCYYLTAREIGIRMMDSELLDDKHFVTHRYDRIDGEKVHSLTASGMTGWDYKIATESSYENLFRLCSFLKIPHAQLEELYKRMIFNLIFQNTDDHLKNHSFIYDRKKDRWSLSPAYDLTYASNPLLDFKKTSRALSINNKRTDITLKDVLLIAENYTIKNPTGIIQEVEEGRDILKKHMDQHPIPTRIKELITNKLVPLK